MYPAQIVAVEVEQPSDSACHIFENAFVRRVKHLMDIGEYP
jgi:hypothetical protein